MGGGHMMDGGLMGGFGFPFLGPILFLLLLAGAVWLIVSLVRSGGARTDPAPEDPVAILKRRFAQGEIDEAEYRARLKTLGR